MIAKAGRSPSRADDSARAYALGVTLRLPEDWRVPAVYAAISVGGLLYDAAHGWFWHGAHDTASLAAAFLLLLLVLLLRRKRFAWWMLVVVSAFGLITAPLQFAGGPVGRQVVAGYVLGLIEFGLLVSAPMRRFVGFHWRMAPRPS